MPVGSLDQEAPLAEFESVVERPHGVDLVRPESAGLALANVVLGDLDGGERLAVLLGFDQPFQVALREEARHLARVVVLPVPEVGLFAVRQEDEGRVERLGVGKSLLLGHVGVDRVPLGLDDGQRAAAPVVENVVRPSAAGRGAVAGLVQVENLDEFAHDAQIALGFRGEDEGPELRIRVERFQADLAVPPGVRAGAVGGFPARVALDRELAAECRVGASPVPDENPPAFAASSPVGAKQAPGAVRDRRFHGTAFDASHEVVAGEADRPRHGRPADLVAWLAREPVRAEVAGGCNEVVGGGVRLERLGAEAVNEGAGPLRHDRRRFGDDHRLVARIPSRLPQHVVDLDPGVSLGLAGGHRAFLEHGRKLLSKPCAITASDHNASSSW